MFLTKQDIAAKRWPIEEVELPDFDGRKVRIKTLSTGEFLRLAELEKQHPTKAYALWWIVTVCDETGETIFDESDIDTIVGLPFSSVAKVSEAVKRLNRVADLKGDAGPNA